MAIKTFNELEIEAMKLADRLNVSPSDEDALNLLAKIMHNAYGRSGRSFISIGVEDCRRLRGWMDR